MTNVLRTIYPLSSFNYRLSGANVANYNKITVAVAAHSPDLNPVDCEVWGMVQHLP